MTQKARVTNKTELHKRREQVYAKELMFEAQILHALEDHPLRTLDPNNASVFVVPTPIGEFFCQNQSYDAAFEALTESPIYKRVQGHQHVIVAITDHFFNHPFRSWFIRLKNVTIVRSYDPNACKDYIHNNATAASVKGNDFYPLFYNNTPMKTTRSMSIGLAAEPDVPLTLASFGKFQTSRLFLFYQTTNATSRYDSTKYRHAPVKVNASQLPQPSSIGHGISHEQWLSDLGDSKYCLVIRGDTPHSHALFSALRVGCIPVIISDWYPIYAPPFPSSLNMWDFCIFIKERDFIQDPVGSLKQLETLNETKVRAKIRALSLAQQLVFIDHPKSLFVEAFIEEVFQSNPNNAARNFVVDMLQG